jgi:hypothetical protein
VTVGWRARNEFGREHSGSSRPILHNKLLPKRFGEALRDQAGHAVAVPACRKWHDDFDRSLRPMLGLRGRCQGQKYPCY